MADYTLPDNSLFFEAPWLTVVATGWLPVVVAGIVLVLLIATYGFRGRPRRKR